jgi:hypothetical protein
MLGYAIGFVAAFVLWLLLGAATAHADDAARPADDAQEPTLTSSLLGVVHDVAAPLTEDSGRLVHHATDTVRKTVAAVPVPATERPVEPVLALVDRTVDTLHPVRETPAEAPGTPDAAPVSHTTAPAPAPHRVDRAHHGRHVTTHGPVRAAHPRHVPARDLRPTLRADARPHADLGAAVSAARAVTPHAVSPAADTVTSSLPGPVGPVPSGPADRTSAASGAAASTDAALPRLSGPRLLATVAVGAPTTTEPRSAVDPLPDCSPD